MKPLLLAALLLSLATQAHAQTQPTPSPGVRPRGSPAQETSAPSSAPPAGTATTAGSTSQDPGVKAMNDAEKAKVEAKGK